MLKSTPSFYRHAFKGDLESLFEIDKPEKLADCSACTLDLKCCTYYPFWVNFMVGDFLTTANSAEKEPIENLIKNNEYVLPLGIFAPPSYQHKFNLAEKPYGEDETLLCPFYVDGNCGVWRSRPSECVRFHCKSRFGVQGIEWWGKFGEYLHHFEMRLSQEVLLEMGYHWKEIEEQMALIKMDTKKPGFKKDQRLTPDQLAHYWAHQTPGLDFFVRARELAMEKIELVLESKDLQLKGQNLKHNFLEMVHRRG